MGEGASKEDCPGVLMRASPLLGDEVQSPWRSSRISCRAHLRIAPQRADGVRVCIPAGVFS